MEKLPIVNTLSNQSFNFTADEDFYSVTIRASIKIMLITIVRNNVTIVRSKRCIPNQYLLSKYQEKGRGNFAFWNSDHKYPWYTDFGVDTTLMYFTPDELKNMRARI